MFDISVQQDELMKSLSSIKNTVSKPKPKDEDNDFDIYVKMELKNNKLQLTGTNMTDISVANCNIVSNNGDKEINSLIQFNTLYTLIETLDENTVIDIADTEKGKVNINYANRIKPIQVASVDKSKFLIKEPNDKILQSCTIKYSDLKDIIEHFNNIIGTTSSNPVFNCINIHIDNSKVIAKGFDGCVTSRMCLFCKILSHKGSLQTFVDFANLKKVFSSLDDNQNVVIEVTSNYFIITQSNETHYIKLNTGKYPNIEKYMPDKYPSIYELNRSDLLKALYRIKAISKHATTSTFTFNDNNIQIEVNTSKGSNIENVDCIKAGKSISKIAFDTQVMIDTLKQFSTDTVRLCFYALNNCVLMPQAKQTYLYRILLRAMTIKNKTK